MIGLAQAVHSEIETKGNLLDLADEIEEARKKCIGSCEILVSEPKKYIAGDYKVNNQDVEFLRQLLEMVRTTDWQSKQGVKELRNFVYEYCRI